jgi:hypothetical protein
VTELPVDPVRAFRRRLREPVWWVLRTIARPTARWRVLPDYLIIGAQRSGTTSLQGVLMAHPAIKAPRLMKGVHFFDTAYTKGLSWYRSNFHTAAWQMVRERLGSRRIVTGEASPYYLFHPAAPQRIRSDLPAAKLIVLLRDPVERTISHYKHEVRLGYETLPLSEALEREAERLAGEEEKICADPGYVSFSHQHFSYASRSLYAGQLRRVYDLFPADQVLVLQSEPLFAEPQVWFPHVLDFLGAAPWSPGTFPRLNPTPAVPVDPAIRTSLADRFAGPNARLFELLGREFSWR